MPEEQPQGEQGPGGLEVGGDPLTIGPAPADPAAAAAEGTPPPEPGAQTAQAAAPPAMKNKSVPIEKAILAQKERKKHANKYNNLGGIPSDMAPRWELIVTEAAKRIKAKRDTIKIAIGDKPYRGIPVTEEEAEIRYLQMRDNAKLQTKSLEENTTMSVDGRLLVNKEYVKALKKMEDKLRKGEIQTR